MEDASWLTGSTLATTVSALLASVSQFYAGFLVLGLDLGAIGRTLNLSGDPVGALTRASGSA